jgi:enoyl-CoA hydratase
LYVPTPEAQFTIDGPVGYLTFNRPEARNAMTWTMYDALAETCAEAEAGKGIRVLVLRTIGDAFIAGTDIRQFTGFRSGEDGIAYERRMESVIARLERVPVPTIAQVQGAAAGGGCMIALVCDLRVCTPSAKFGVPIARTLGNCLSAANYARLLDLIGPARTKDLLFTGRMLDVTEASTLGLVTRIADAGAIDDVVRDLAREIAKNAPFTIGVTKESIRRISEHRRLAPGTDDDLIAACYASQDFREGVEAFVAKRAPTFTGR